MFRGDRLTKRELDKMEKDILASKKKNTGEGARGTIVSARSSELSSKIKERIGPSQDKD